MSSIITACFLKICKKVVTPRFELGSREPKSRMLPLHHATIHTWKHPRHTIHYIINTTNTNKINKTRRKEEKRKQKKTKENKRKQKKTKEKGKDKYNVNVKVKIKIKINKKKERKRKKRKRKKRKKRKRKRKRKIVCFIHLNHSVLLKKRQWQDLNLRLQWRSDFESPALDHSATLSYYPTILRLYYGKLSK